MASRVPESSKLTSPAGVTTASVWPPRIASTTGSALSSGTRMPCASTTLAVPAIGASLSIESVTGSSTPTCKFHLSLASTSPQPKSRLMMKASVMPLA